MIMVDDAKSGHKQRDSPQAAQHQLLLLDLFFQRLADTFHGLRWITHGIDLSLYLGDMADAGGFDQDAIICDGVVKIWVALAQKPVQVVQGDHDAVCSFAALGVVLFYHAHRTQRHGKNPSFSLQLQSTFLTDGVQIGVGNADLVAAFVPVAVKAADHVIPFGPGSVPEVIGHVLPDHGLPGMLGGGALQKAIAHGLHGMKIHGHHIGPLGHIPVVWTGGQGDRFDIQRILGGHGLHAVQFSQLLKQTVVQGLRPGCFVED